MISSPPFTNVFIWFFLYPLLIHTRIYVGTLACTPGAGFSILKPYPN